MRDARGARAPVSAGPSIPGCLTGRGPRSYSAASAGRTIMASFTTASDYRLRVVVRSWRPIYNLYR